MSYAIARLTMVCYSVKPHTADCSNQPHAGCLLLPCYIAAFGICGQPGLPDDCTSICWSPDSAIFGVDWRSWAMSMKNSSCTENQSVTTSYDNWRPKSSRCSYTWSHPCLRQQEDGTTNVSKLVKCYHLWNRGRPHPD